MSVVWTYFTVTKNNATLTICKICSAEIPKGSSLLKNFITTGLTYNLRAQHTGQHKEFSVFIFGKNHFGASLRKTHVTLFIKTPYAWKNDRHAASEL